MTAATDGRDYVPIACVLHERLEFAVLRRQSVRLSIRDRDTPAVDWVVVPCDVYTRDGAEWLSYRTPDGENGTIRLDRIFAVEAAS